LPAVNHGTLDALYGPAHCLRLEIVSRISTSFGELLRERLIFPAPSVSGFSGDAGSGSPLRFTITRKSIEFPNLVARRTR
jgi:hypothetical protein